MGRSVLPVDDNFYVSILHGLYCPLEIVRFSRVCGYSLRGRNRARALAYPGLVISGSINNRRWVGCCPVYETSGKKYVVDCHGFHESGDSNCGY